MQMKAAAVLRSLSFISLTTTTAESHAVAEITHINWQDSWQISLLYQTA